MRGRTSECARTHLAWFILRRQQHRRKLNCMKFIKQNYVLIYIRQSWNSENIQMKNVCCCCCGVCSWKQVKRNERNKKRTKEGRKNKRSNDTVENSNSSVSAWPSAAERKAPHILVCDPNSDRMLTKQFIFLSPVIKYLTTCSSQAIVIHRSNAPFSH